MTLYLKIRIERVKERIEKTKVKNVKVKKKT